MKEEDFEEIIKPLYLLDGKQREWMLQIIRANFHKWEKNNQNQLNQ